MFLMFQFLVFTLLLLLNTFIRYWYFWFDFCYLLWCVLLSFLRPFLLI